MGILSDQSIETWCRGEDPLITPFTTTQLRPASYDLRIGQEFYIHHPDHDRRGTRSPVIDTLTPTSSFVVPPNAVCFIITEERVHLPNALAGSLSLRLEWVKKGLLLAKQPPLDPGYSGRLVAMLYNLSNRDVMLTRGKAFLSVEFQEVVGGVHEAYPEEKEGSYMNLESLSQFLELPVVSSLEEMRGQFEKWQSRTLNHILAILTATAITVAILTAMVGFVGLKERSRYPETESPIRPYSGAFGSGFWTSTGLFGPSFQVIPSVLHIYRRLVPMAA